MLELFNYFRDLADPNDDRKDFIEHNLYDETKCFRDWLANDNPAPDHPNFKLFDPEPSINIFLRDNPKIQVDHDIVRSWFNDSRFDFMAHVSAIQDQYRNNSPKSVLDEWQCKTDYYFNIDWSSAHVFLTIQQPGTVFPLHYDKNKNARFGIKNAGYGEAEEKTTTPVGRWLIMLDDQQLGQVFYINGYPVQWKAGDVITWDNWSYHHGGANFGFSPRYCIHVTGKRNQQ